MGLNLEITNEEIHLLSKQVGDLIQKYGVFGLAALGSYQFAIDNPDKTYKGPNFDAKSMLKVMKYDFKRLQHKQFVRINRPKLKNIGVKL